MNKGYMIEHNNSICRNIGYNGPKSVESKRCSMENTIRITDKTHQLHDMVGYLIANRSMDDQVLIYLPINKSKGYMMSISFSKIHRE